MTLLLHHTKLTYLNYEKIPLVHWATFVRHSGYPISSPSKKELKQAQMKIKSPVNNHFVETFRDGFPILFNITFVRTEKEKGNGPGGERRGNMDEVYETKQNFLINPELLRVFP